MKNLGFLEAFQDCYDHIIVFECKEMEMEKPLKLLATLEML